MKMRFITLITALLIALSGAHMRAQQPAATLFPYPTVPDTISAFGDRADFFITHFWDHADLPRVFSNRSQFRAAFGDYVALMPHARPEVAQSSIEAFLSRMKKVPAQVPFVGEVARQMLYGDSATFWSDDCFLPFADAVASSKKASEAQRSSMRSIAKALRATRRGAPAPQLRLTSPAGSPFDLVAAADSLSYQVIFFANPADESSTAARRELDTDILVSRLVRNGLVKVTTVVTADPADEAFTGRMAALNPEGWSLGASPEVKTVYDVRYTPSFYLLTGQGYIVEKNLSVADVISVLYRLRRLKAAQPAHQAAPAASPSSASPSASSSASLPQSES